MKTEVFNKILKDGQLTWEEKHPINLLHFPSPQEDKQSQSIPEKIAKNQAAHRNQDSQS